MPICGGFFIRHAWRKFRKRFDELRLKPLLNYKLYQNPESGGGTFRLLGGFESVTDGHTLWIRNKELTIPVALEGAHTYILPMPENEDPLGFFDPGREVPERIHWNRVSTLAEGAKVYVGGELRRSEDRWTFVSTKETPLLVIFYDGPDRSLAVRAIRAGRHRNEYWNRITPYSLIMGAFMLIAFTVSYLPRPAFRLTVLTSITAMFLPLFPFLPPGILMTSLYRRLWWNARIYRAFRDLVRLPLKYLVPGTDRGTLPDGEGYGYVRFKDIPPELHERGVPVLPPGEKTAKGAEWYFFGALPSADMASLETVLPGEPKDPLATYGIIPGRPEELARSYTLKAYMLEGLATLALLSGVVLNLLFIGIIMYVLR